MKWQNLFLITLAAVALTAGTSLGQADDYDPFDYEGTTLTGQTGGTGWSGGWIATGTTAPSNTLSDDDVSLSYPVTFESPLTTPPSDGSRIRTGGLTSNASNSRLMSETTSLLEAANTMYASALIRKNRLNGEAANDNILLEFTDSIGNRRFGFGIEGTGDRPWLNANGSTTAATEVTAGDTYFMVAKIVSGAAPDLDTAFLKVFGTSYASQVPAAEPTTWDATLTQNTGAILDRVRVRIDPGNTVEAPGEVDDIRIGDSWEAVVGVIPEPSSLALLGLAGVGFMRRRGCGGRRE